MEWLNNLYLQGALAVIAAVLFIVIAKRYSAAVASTANILSLLRSIAHDILGDKYPKVFAVVAAIAESAAIVQDGLSEQEQKDIAAKFITGTDIGKSLTEVQLSVVVNITVYLANLLKGAPQGRKITVLRQLSP
jgi:hypothetical protein